MTVTVRALPDQAIGGWIDASMRAYAAERHANGEAPEVAEAKARASREQNFPNGRPLSTHAVLQVLSDGEPVGILWIGPLDPERQHEWWVFSIDIDEAVQNRGIGREAMRLAEVVARERGATKLGLNVFGGNVRAQNLYRSLEYRVTAMQMSKDL